MKRVLRPCGMIMILEGLVWGTETPRPTDAWAAYHTCLEKEYGFSSTWIRTDYGFESLAEAQELTRFFGGDEPADRVSRENWVIVPECSGIWWLTV